VNTSQSGHQKTEGTRTRPQSLRDRFRGIATRIAEHVGSPWAFLGGLTLIVIWALTGPAMGYSDTWQLVINTGTTVITFLMVFLIQNTQNRDAKAVHLKLDELLKAMKGARTELVDLEDMSDREIEALQEEFRALHARLSRTGHLPAIDPSPRRR
jgi:low affinity Fe/Cu permease